MNWQDVKFSKEELERYSRHIIIPEFNIQAQQKLKAAKVLVVGTGGLGSPLLLYLAAAGVGTLGLVDFDVVDESNLQRQVLYGVDEVGKPKVEMAAKRIRQLNPHVNVITYNTMLNSENALDIIRDFDVVADGTDNFPTRYLVNDACVILNKTNVYASIFRFDGQVSVFNYTDKDGVQGPHYRDLYPEPPPPGLVPSCAEGGVLGVLPGIIGSMQANEVIKVITGVGEPLSGRLFVFDAARFDTRVLKISKDPNTAPVRELIDYEMFCGMGEPEKPFEEHRPVKEIDVWDLKNMQENKEDFQLIDVREPHEYSLVNIGGELIPLASVGDEAGRISGSKKVIIHCRSGVRSANAIRLLEDQKGLDNLYNLKGGILAYAREIDPSLPEY